MVTKRSDAFIADFDSRYSRWLVAQESGNEAELKAAAAALPTLNARLLAKLAALDEDEPDPQRRATEKRLFVLVSERKAEETRRRRKRKEAEQRRRDRTIRVERTADLPTACARCGAKLAEVKTTGRPRVYCSAACRKAAYEDRRAHRDGAVKVQVVEKVITEVRERRIEVPHPRSECFTSILDDEDAMIGVIWTLTALVRANSLSEYDPGQPKFNDLYQHVKRLCEVLERRMESA